MNQKIYAANWKMYKSPSESEAFFMDFNEFSIPSDTEVVFFPPAVNWERVSGIKNGQTVSWSWGAQNIHPAKEGAFTGENSPAILKSMGGTHALVGHSERRSIFEETDEQVALKVQFLQQNDIVPVLCIGETLQERQEKKTFRVLEMQLQQGLSLADAGKKAVIAYEPVWAIGTGEVATVAQVAEAHSDIQDLLKAMGFNGISVLYGGSVKPENAKELKAVPNVDGFLVGGASLKPESFNAIIQA